MTRIQSILFLALCLCAFGAGAQTNADAVGKLLQSTATLIEESSLAKRAVNVDEVLAGELRNYQQPIDERFGLL